MYYLSVAEVLRIHQQIMDKQALVRDMGLLESAVARPMSSAFGQDAYPTLFHKAAALLESLSRNHPFVDGNKRTAAVAAMSFLRENGWHARWETEAAADFVVDVAQGFYTIDQIASWLEANCEPIDE